MIDLHIAHIGIILATFFVTFCRILGKSYFWCIDDIEGIARYSESWDDKNQKKNDSYEIGEGASKHSVKFLSFIPELRFPGNIVRFLRLQIGKQYCVIGKNAKGHDIWGFRQSPRRHHVLSMIVQSCVLILGYTFLLHFLPANLAFLSVLLFAVHPLTTQGVGWISGVNYSISMLFSLALINTCIYFPIPEFKLFLVFLFSFFSSIILYVGCFNFIVLFFLGFKVEALISMIVGLSILLWKGINTQKIRVDAFKEQNMQSSTFWNWRKPVVMAKTLFYYLGQIFIPLRLGLYHTFGYFYEDPIDRITPMFWGGIATLIGLGFAFGFGAFPIKLGIVWFLAYYILFSNFITAMQFVADRYVMIPCFGVCIALAYLLQGTPFFWILLGIYMMRTFLHLPTFRNELDFYHSNFLNFRKSEVSLGNLGVAFINQGMTGAAVDFWIMATKINPLYDVPWYNLYSVFKGSGQLTQARDFLKKCLDAKVVHFDKRWQEELQQIEATIHGKTNPNPVADPLSQELLKKASVEFQKMNPVLELDYLKQFQETSKTGVAPEMILAVSNRITELENANKVQLHNPGS